VERRNKITLLEGSLDFPARPPDVSSIKVKALEWRGVES
jgi:hypothetical protein